MSEVNFLLFYRRLALTQIPLNQCSKELLVRQDNSWADSPQKPEWRVIGLAINWGIRCGLSAQLDLDNTIPYESKSGGNLCSLMISPDETKAGANLDDMLFPLPG